MLTVDLNADLGEECGDDDAMLNIVTSANLACGMHAGNTSVMMATIAAAAVKGVRLGAHPSYPDRANFGRISMPSPTTSREFKAALKVQLDSFYTLNFRLNPGAHGRWGYSIPYIKPHGALYNDAAMNPALARLLVGWARDYRSAVMHQPGTWVQHYADERGVPFIAEVFADRAYLPDGTLAPRSVDGSVLHDENQIARRVVRMVTDGTVECIDGSVFEFSDVDSVCVHGDTPGAVQIAAAVRSALTDAGVAIAATRPDSDESHGGSDESEASA